MSEASRSWSWPERPAAISGAPDRRIRHPLPPGPVRGAYPERPDEPTRRFDDFARALVAPIARRRGRLVLPRESLPLAVAESGRALTAERDGDLARLAVGVGYRLRHEGFELAPVADAFALTREASRRELGMSPYDVQLLGAWVLLQGMVAEMQTGEGKTLAAALAAATAALAGIPTHVVTVNDYLARRDADQLRPLYRALGLSVGVALAGCSAAERRAAYRCDITYTTNKEAAFNYLRDRIALRGATSRARIELEGLAGTNTARELIHRGLHFAIIDEVDSVLIDEAKTPLLISGHSRDPDETELYRGAARLAEALRRGEDYRVDARERRVLLTDEGRGTLAELCAELGGAWSARRWRESLVHQALTARELFERDRDYLIRDGKVLIIDEYTGRVMPDRTWDQGLHQAVELREGLDLSQKHATLARISTQRFFRRYLRIAGMTGTARDAAAELWSTYRLAVVPIPTNRPRQRRDLGERVFVTAAARWAAVVDRVAALHRGGRPVLVGTRSVGASEEISRRLADAGIEHTVLNARQDAEEAAIVARAGARGRVTVATNMAGRGTDIPLGPGVVELGGLHVIATERHDSRRIDRQLFGRCARQGDPGSIEALVSLEDDLIDQNAAGLRSLLQKVVGEALPAGLGRWLLGRSQARASRLHARMRRSVMASDRARDRQLAFSGPTE